MPKILRKAPGCINLPNPSLEDTLFPSLSDQHVFQIATESEPFNLDVACTIRLLTGLVDARRLHPWDVLRTCDRPRSAGLLSQNVYTVQGNVLTQTIPVREFLSVLLERRQSLLKVAEF